MKVAGEIAFYMAMIALAAAAFSLRLRDCVLENKGIALLERWLRAQNVRYTLAVVLCLAAGFFARCYRFGELPLGLNQDGTMAGVEAYCLLMDGVDSHGISWPAYFEAWEYSQMSTLYSYLLIPFIRALGLNRFSLRLPMLLVSLASLVILWDFARRIAGKGYALAVLFIAAINPWQITQSRWALEANLLPHLLLAAVYLLYLGRQSRLALYGSMILFGLTPYAYGVALFSTPVLLITAAVFYLARKKVRLPDVAICVLIFVAVSGPYLVTMAVNALGLETIKLGKLTMPCFADSLRSRDIALFQERPYRMMIWNLYEFLTTFLIDRGYVGDWVDWAHTMYRFAPPLIVCGLYWMWRNRRSMALSSSECAARDGLMLILLWMGAAAVNGMMIGGVVNRCNVVFYPLMLLCAYGIWQMGKRLHVAAAGAVTLLGVAFVCFCGVYFTDEEYQKNVGTSFHYGVQEALEQVCNTDADRIYVTTMSSNLGKKVMFSQVMFANKIDYSQLIGKKKLTKPNGSKMDQTFEERFIFQDFQGFVPDPEEDAAYIVEKNESRIFDEEQFEIVNIGTCAAVYPRNASR